MNDTVSPIVTRIDGPAPEVKVTKDMVRRGLIVAPLLVALCGFIWGMDGALSSVYAVALVLVNFGLAAGIVAGTARISLGLMMGGVLFGYL
ncbi:MAG TPA: ATP synthase subunit I, partial [Ilumatobacteraceae bacterium]|nr:ATP synthase subunit I [Ilumatobacteraceae bacterium]